MTKDTTLLVSVRGDGRVILDDKSHGDIVQTITAKAFDDARTLVDVPMYENPGCGMYHLEEE